MPKWNFGGKCSATPVQSKQAGQAFKRGFGTLWHCRGFRTLSAKISFRHSGCSILVTLSRSKSFKIRSAKIERSGFSHGADLRSGIRWSAAKSCGMRFPAHTPGHAAKNRCALFLHSFQIFSIYWFWDIDVQKLNFRWSSGLALCVSPLTRQALNSIWNYFPEHL